MQASSKGATWPFTYKTARLELFDNDRTGKWQVVLFLDGKATLYSAEGSQQRAKDLGSLIQLGVPEATWEVDPEELGPPRTRFDDAIERAIEKRGGAI